VDYPLTAIISDLHANEPALETALADARSRGARRFVCLGDAVGYGAKPRFVLDWVMRLCVAKPDAPAEFGPLEPGLCLQGNHEYALLESAEDFNPKARAAIEWTHEELTNGGARDRGWDYWDFIGELKPLMRDEVAMFAHGSPRDPVREYLVPRDNQDEDKMRACFAQMDRSVCFVGHSHVPAIFREDGQLVLPRGTEGPFDLGFASGARAIVNTGSVGQPRDGDPRLSYVMFDGATVTFVRCDYDVAAAQHAIREVPGLPDYLAERLAVGR
jgi:diadenosine tetraphosphatase ApaH/serine/threonine PP2A family protein phosphatase